MIKKHDITHMSAYQTSTDSSGERLHHGIDSNDCSTH